MLFVEDSPTGLLRCSAEHEMGYVWYPVSEAEDVYAFCNYWKDQYLMGDPS